MTLPIDLVVLEAYARTGADEGFGRAISEVCAELRKARRVMAAVTLEPGAIDPSDCPSLAAYFAQVQVALYEEDSGD